MKEQEVKQYQRVVQSNNLKNFKCNVYIENLPSRAEFYMLLERFVKEQGRLTDYKLTNRTTGVDIKFKNPDYAYDFLKYLSFYKQDNPIYSKMKAILNLDAKTRFLSPEFNDKDKFRDNNTRNCKDISYNVYIFKLRVGLIYDFIKRAFQAPKVPRLKEINLKILTCNKQKMLGPKLTVNIKIT